MGTQLDDSDSSTLAATLSSLASALQTMAEAEAELAATSSSTSSDSNSILNSYNNIDNFPLASQILASVQGNLSLISEDDELKLLNYPSRREDLSTAIPLTVIFALLLVTGCIGNLCTAIVIARPKNKYMHTATNYYLFSLAMSDFLFLILGLPQEMYALWQRYPYAFGESFCIIRSYLSEASTYASILTISAFTIERYVAICHPLWAHTMSQLPRAITSIVIIWMLAAVCAIPPAAQLGIVTQRGPLTNQTLEQSAQCVQKRTIYENLFAVSAIVFFIVPMIIVTVLYILIAIELRRSSKMNSQIQKQTSSHLYSGPAGQTSHTANSLAAHLHHAHHAHHSTSPSQPHHHATHHHRKNHKHHHHHHHHPHDLHHEPRHHNHHCCHRNKTPNSNNNELQLTRSQQLLPMGCMYAASPAAAAREGASNGHLERPKSALGTGNELCASPTCCLLGLAHGQQARAAGAGSSLAGSLARLQLPSLLGAYQQAKMWPWRASNSSLEPTGATRPPSTATCCEPGQGPIDGQAAHEQDDERQRRPISRQHSPLSYHESLIQRQASSCPTCRRTVAAAGGPATAGPTAKLLHLGRHQMSLPHSPISSCVHQQSRGEHNNEQFASQQQLINRRHLMSSQYRHTNQQQHHHCHHHHHHHHHHAHHHLHHSTHHLKAFFQQQQQQQQHSRRSAAASSKKSVVRMLVAVVVSFFICWLPFHAQRLLAAYLAKVENQNQLLLDIYAKITYISGVMYYLSSTINPLLYQLMSAKFRLAFKETFKCSLFKCGAILYYCCCCFCLPWRSPKRTPKPMGAGSSFAAPPKKYSPTNSVRETTTNNNNNNNPPPASCCACSCCSDCQQQQQHQEQASMGPAKRDVEEQASGLEASTSIVSNNLQQPTSSSCCLSSSSLSLCYQHQQTGRAKSIKSRLTWLLIRLFPSGAGRANERHLTSDCQCREEESAARRTDHMGASYDKQQEQHAQVSASQTVPSEPADQTTNTATCAASAPLLCVHSAVEQQLEASAICPMKPAGQFQRMPPPAAGTKSAFKLMRASSPVGGFARRSPQSPCREDSAGELQDELASEPLKSLEAHTDHQQKDDEAQRLLAVAPTEASKPDEMEQLIRATSGGQPMEQPLLLLSSSSANSSQGTSPDQLASSLQSTTSAMSSANEIIATEHNQRHSTNEPANRSPSSSSRNHRPKLDSTESGSSGTGDLMATRTTKSINPMGANQLKQIQAANESTKRRRRSLQQMRSFNNNNNNNNHHHQHHDSYHLTGNKMLLMSGTNERHQRRKSSSVSAAGPQMDTTIDMDTKERRKHSIANQNQNNNLRNLSSSLSSSERHLDSKRFSLSTTTTSAMLLDDNASFSTTNSSFQLTSGCSNNQPLNQSRHSMELVQL